MSEISTAEAWAVLMGFKTDPPIAPREFISTQRARSSRVQEILTEMEPKIFVHSVPCPNCKEEQSRLPPSGICPTCEGVGEEMARIEGRVEAILGKWGKERFTFQNFVPDSDGHAELKRAAMEFNPRTKSLMLLGGPGTGKTHLAAAILQKWALYFRGSVAFERTSHLMRMIRGLRGADEAAYIENLAAKRLLIIDDLGVGRATEFTVGILYEIIEERINRGLSGLVVTTNLSLDDISRKFGDDRLSSRLSGMCRVIENRLEDWRNK